MSHYPPQKDQIEAQIFKILSCDFSPEFLKVINESDHHSGPKGRESHFAVLIVSQKFLGISRIDRQRSVFSSLSEIIPIIHALTLRALTLEEWKNKNPIGSFKSPNCVKNKIKP